VIFKNKYIYIFPNKITYNNKTLPVSIFELLNLQIKSTELFNDISNKTVILILENSLQTHHESLLALFSKKAITIQKIMLQNNQTLYTKPKNYRQLSIALTCIALIAISISLHYSHYNATQALKYSSKTKQLLQDCTLRLAHFENPIFQSALTILESLNKSSLLIEKIILKPHHAIKLIGYSYQKPQDFMQSNNDLSIKKLTQSNYGNYYEITYSF